MCNDIPITLFIQITAEIQFPARVCMSAPVLKYFVIKSSHLVKTLVTLYNKKAVALCERISIGLTVSSKTAIKFKR